MTNATVGLATMKLSGVRAIAAGVDDQLAWRLALEHERQWRETLYTGSETPLSPEARAQFKGLVWFTPNLELRLRGVKLRRLPQAKPSNLAATGPDAVKMVEIGRFDFDLEGQPHSLHAFAPAPGEADEDYILIPFRDQTSGKETYGAGRYLDVEPRADDVYEIDFNRAYAPYCAHDDAWSCTLPPPENTLKAPIEAGERQ